MSQFVTIIPCDIENVKRLLPAKSFIEDVAWNPHTQSVELVWSNSKLATPFTIPTPFTVQMLHDKEIPKSAKFTGEQKPVEVAVVSVKEPVDTKRKKGVKVTPA